MMMDAAAAAATSPAVLVDHQGTKLDALKEKLHSTTERLETRVSKMTHTTIPRFPHWLRGIGGSGDSYVAPSVLAIGPYYHGLPHLQEMEEFKHAAAHMLCGDTVDKVYEKVLSVADEARRCYDVDDKSLVEVSDADFANMMFLDGCFLVWFIAGTDPDEDNALAKRCYHSSGPYIMNDMFLLENQIPLVVLEALMEFKPQLDMSSWIQFGVKSFFYREEEKVRPWIVRLRQTTRCRLVLGKQRINTTTTNTDETSSIVNDGDCNNKPPHLLGLLRSSMIRGMPPEKRSAKPVQRASKLSRGAVSLAQIGVKITASKAEWFADMNVHKNLVSGELSLSPLDLGVGNACRLVNMAALEATGLFAILTPEAESDGYVVSSYLSTMAMLMDRKEDVHELRRRGVLSGKFTNAETLVFFKGLAQNLRQGYYYFGALQEIEGYMRRRPVRIAFYKFVYNNYRIIAAVLSIAGVVVSILKALYSLKKP